MSVLKHIEHIGETEALIHANLDTLQMSISTDGQENFIFANEGATLFKHVALQYAWNGVSNIYEDNVMNDLELFGDLLIPGEIKRSGGTDDKITFIDDVISVTAGGSENFLVKSTHVEIPVDVGIGTSTPGATLDVLTDANDDGIKVRTTSNPLHDFIKNGATQDGIYQAFSSGVTKVQLHTNGNSYLNGGNVGIGTNAPTQFMEVRKDQNAETRLYVQNFTAGTASQTSVVLGQTGRSMNISAFSSSHSSAEFAGKGVVQSTATEGLSLFASHSSGEIEFYAGGSTASEKRMTITSAGPVGIGTISPDTLLEISDDTAQMRITATGATTNDPWLHIGHENTKTTQGLKLWFDSSGGTAYIDNFYDNDNGTLFIRTKAAGTPINAVTILGSGEVGFGTNAPSFELDILGNSAGVVTTNLTNENSAGTNRFALTNNTALVFTMKTHGSTHASRADENWIGSEGSDPLILSTSDTERLRITPAGDVYSTAFTDYSGSTTVTGWVATTTVTVKYKLIGKQAFVFFYLDGTGGGGAGTEFTFSLPFSIDTTHNNGIDLHSANEGGATQCMSSSDAGLATRVILAKGSDPNNIGSKVGWIGGGGQKIAQGTFTCEIQ